MVHKTFEGYKAGQSKVSKKKRTNPSVMELMLFV